MMLNRFVATAAGVMAMVAMSAFAVDLSQVEKTVPLKDGATIYVLKGGKMGMEDKYGRAAYMEPGVVMETKDGQRVVMIGNEVAYVSSVLGKDNRK